MTNFANKTKKGRKHSNLSIEEQRHGMASALPAEAHHWWAPGVSHPREPISINRSDYEDYCDLDITKMHCGHYWMLGIQGCLNKR